MLYQSNFSNQIPLQPPLGFPEDADLKLPRQMVMVTFRHDNGAEFHFYHVGCLAETTRQDIIDMGGQIRILFVEAYKSVHGMPCEECLGSLQEDALLTPPQTWLQKIGVN